MMRAASRSGAAVCTIRRATAARRRADTAVGGAHAAIGCGTARARIN